MRRLWRFLVPLVPFAKYRSQKAFIRRAFTTRGSLGLSEPMTEKVWGTWEEWEERREKEKESERKFFFIAVPTATILGGPELYVGAGSTINLTCAIRFSSEPPAYIFWYYNENVLSYDSPRGGVSVITEKGGDVTTSWLLIQTAQPSDSGEYSCKPSNANTASIRVHVLNGESLLLRVRQFCSRRRALRATRDNGRETSCIFSGTRYFFINWSGLIKSFTYPVFLFSPKVSLQSETFPTFI